MPRVSFTAIPLRHPAQPRAVPPPAGEGEPASSHGPPGPGSVTAAAGVAQPTLPTALASLPNPQPTASLESSAVGSAATAVITGNTVYSGHKSAVPEIDGSEGGFIGLVVGLVVLIVVCCIGVFFLLRQRGGGGNPRRNREGAVAMEFPSQGGFFASALGAKVRPSSAWGRLSQDSYRTLAEPAAGDGYKLETFSGKDRSMSPRPLSPEAFDETPEHMPYGHHVRDSTSSSASTVRLEAPNDRASGQHTMGDEGAISPPPTTSAVRGGTADSDATRFASPPTSPVHPLGVAGSRFHEIIS